MKIIKPQDLVFTSNIMEPDPAMGEAVWQSSESTTYPFPADVKSISFDSVNGTGYINKTSNALPRVYGEYSTSIGSIANRNVAYGNLSKIDGAVNCPKYTYDAAYYGGVLLAVDGNNDVIYRSDDGGVTWSQIVVSFANGKHPYRIVFDENTGDVFCSAWGEVITSDDGGLTWTLSVADNGEAGSGTGLVFDGNYISLLDNRYCRRYLSGSWSDFDDITDDSIHFATADGGDIYVMTRNINYEILKSTNGGASFTSLYEFTGNQVSCFHVLNGFAYIATFDDELYRVDLSDSTITTLTINGNEGVCFYAVSAGDFVVFSYGSGRIFIASESSSFIQIDDTSDYLVNPVNVDSGVIFLSRENEYAFALPVDAARVTSAFNDVDNSLQGVISTANQTIAGNEYIQITKFAGYIYSQPEFSKSVKLKDGLFNNPEFGQCCADDRFIYQLIKDSGDWFVYKIDTLSSTVTSLDLGADNSGYINNFNSVNPVIFIDPNGINIPINKALPVGRFDTVLRLDSTPAVVVEITPNAELTDTCTAAIFNGADNVNWYLDNDLVEVTDATNYDSLGGYREGDELISLSTHRQYRATTNTLDTPEVGSKKTPPTWTDISPTNKYAWLDIYVHNKTYASNAENSITTTFTLTGNENSAAIFGMENVNELHVVATSSGGEIYNEEISLVDTKYYDKTGYIKTLDQIVLIDKFLGATSVTIELLGESGGDSAAVGRLIVGRAVELGITQYGASLEIEDFSRRERDELGNFTIIPRDTAKNINFDVKIDKEDVNFVFAYLSDITTTPVVWTGDDEDAALQVYGFYADYTNTVDAPSITTGTISVEGLT